MEIEKDVWKESELVWGKIVVAVRYDDILLLFKGGIRYQLTSTPLLTRDLNPHTCHRVIASWMNIAGKSNVKVLPVGPGAIKKAMIFLGEESKY